MTVQERKNINRKLHALAIVIAGAENSGVLLRAEAESLTGAPYGGVSRLTDSHAQALYSRLITVNKNLNRKIANSINEVNCTANTTPITPGQRRAIIRLARYDLQWSIPAIFSYIIETCPSLRARLTGWELSHSKINKLYSLMSLKDADKVIKRLDKIKKKKEEKERN